MFNVFIYNKGVAKIFENFKKSMSFIFCSLSQFNLIFKRDTFFINKYFL